MFFVDVRLPVWPYNLEKDTINLTKYEQVRGKRIDDWITKWTNKKNLMKEITKKWYTLS